MNDREITILLKKADELRSLFVLGQRVIPFLEEIFVFVSEIQPLLDEINSSIEENLKKMPNASKQLSKVTEATELATTEIMDIVDGVVNKTDQMGTNLTKLNSIHGESIDKAVKLLKIMRNGISDKSIDDNIVPQIDKAIDNLANSTKDEETQIVESTNDIIQSISMDSSSIMMSLQVQDITSQQIAAVNNLLERVQHKLSNIMAKFQNSELSNLVPEDDSKGPYNVSKMHRDIAFDPDAVDSISLKHERQSTVDKYMDEHNAADDGPTSQDDIDALFESNQIADDDKEQNKDQSSEDDELSPDDIDKMFDSSTGTQDEDDNSDNSSKDDNLTNNLDGDDDDTEFSQDDIDKMFNS